MAQAAPGDPATTSRWRAVVVVGVGRSGTSAITRALQSLGVALGDDLRPGRGKNPTGFFEDQALASITNRLKKALGIRGPSVQLLDSKRWEAPAIRGLQAEAVTTIERRFGRHRVWGFKHGRTLRLLPFWSEVFRALDMDVRYVVAIRNPLSIARSRARLDRRRGQQGKSDLEWLVTAVPYFRMLRERPFVVVDYDLVMADPVPQLERMAAALELPLTPETGVAMRAYAEEFLQPGLRHSQFSDLELARDPLVNPLTQEAYRWLHGLATDRISHRSPELWEGWERIERALADLGPILLYIDRLEEELRSAKASPLGPLQALPNFWRKLRGR
jgi:hypothetical protein